MKPLPLLLVGSVALNLLVVASFLMRPVAPLPKVRDTAEQPPTAAGSDAAPRAEIPPLAAWKALQSHDLATFAANLRSAGLSDPLVRAIIVAAIDERFHARDEALAPSRPHLHYWEFDDYREPLATRLARLDLRREKAQLRLAALGPDPNEVANDDRLPPAKRELAQMITEDYDAAIRDVRPSIGSMLLPEEQAMLDSLEEEKQKELAAVLTPEQLAEYKMRMSPVTQSLRRELAPFHPTEAEFRAIFAARKEFYEGNFRSHMKSSADFASQEEFVRSMQQAALDQKLREQEREDRLRRELGDERYLTYQRESDPHMRALRSLVDRVDLPGETADRVYDLRANAAEASVRIGDDYSLSIDARRAALRALANDLRSQAQTLLGPAAAEAYLQSTKEWLHHLEQGDKVSFQRNGWSATHLAPNPPPPGP